MLSRSRSQSRIGAETARAAGGRRPFHLLTFMGGAAHHAFELGAGVGLVFQAELGLGGASALWGTAFPLGMAAARRWGGWAEKPLALCVGANLAAVAVHFTLWPWRMVGPLPVLREAEGLPRRAMGPYNAILLAWLAAGLLALMSETPEPRRRWAAAGLLMALPFRKEQKRHLAWMHARRTLCGVTSAWLISAGTQLSLP